MAYLLTKCKSMQGGAPNAMIDVLAGLGSSGKRPGNIRAELVRYVKKLVPTMDPLYHDIPLLITKGPSKGPQLISAGFVLPHQVMHFEWLHFRDSFFLPSEGPRTACANIGLNSELMTLVEIRSQRSAELI